MKKTNSEFVRAEHNKDFTVINNEIFRRKDMSMSAKYILCLALSLGENWHYSINGFTKILKEGRRVVENALKELRDFGYLDITECRDEKGYKKFIYTFYEFENGENQNSENTNNYEENESELEILEECLEELQDENLQENDVQTYKTRCWKRDARNVQQYNTINKILNNKNTRNIIKNNISRPSGSMPILKNNSNKDSLLDDCTRKNENKDLLNGAPTDSIYIENENNLQNVACTDSIHSVSALVNEKMSDINNDVARLMKEVKEAKEIAKEADKTTKKKLYGNKKGVKKLTRTYTDNEALLEVLDEYVDMFYSSFFHMSNSAWQTRLDKLSELASTDKVKIEKVKLAIKNGWKNFYEGYEYRRGGFDNTAGHNPPTAVSKLTQEEVADYETTLAVDENGDPLYF